jgi:hypothetical protein
MTVEIIDCEQGSERWLAVRAGLPTASEFSTILAKGKGGGESVTRRKYLYRLAGEIVSGLPEETYANQYMDRGHVQEPEARELYAFAHDVEPQLVGFVRNGPKGCSPDSLIGDKGMLEIKTAKASILIDYLLADVFPSEHVAQTQGGLWVCEREFIDLAIYSPKLPLFEKRAYRDENYIKSLSIEVARFNGELEAIVERVRQYGNPSTLKADLKRSLG